MATPRPTLGLLTSLPLYWPAGAQIGDLLNDRAEPPPQREWLEARFRLVLLDELGGPEGEPVPALGDLRFLLVVQPRALVPADNVALDGWVRAGGTVLFVLDPRLDGHGQLPVGDPRRPVDVGLAPPVLARWGLRFAERADEAPAAVRYRGAMVPVSQRGEWQLVPPQGPDANCAVQADALIADCRIGRGRALLVADASAFEEGGEQNRVAVATLLDAAFGDTTPGPSGGFGENTGR